MPIAVLDPSLERSKVLKSRLNVYKLQSESHIDLKIQIIQRRVFVLETR